MGIDIDIDIDKAIPKISTSISISIRQFCKISISIKYRIDSNLAYRTGLLTMVALTEHHQSSMCQWCQILYQPQKKPRTVTKTSFRLSLRSSASSLWDHQIQVLLALPSHRDVK